MADLVVHHQSLPELFVAMAERLRQVVAAEAANFSLYDSTRNVMRLHLWEGSGTRSRSVGSSSGRITIGVGLAKPATPGGA